MARIGSRVLESWVVILIIVANPVVYAYRHRGQYLIRENRPHGLAV